MFDTAAPEAYKKHLLEDARPFRRMAALVEPGPYVLGERFSVVDAHLFTILRLGAHAGLDFSRWPAVIAFMKRVGSRPSVVEAFREEGLLEGS
jgi:glutathione S-transferase